MFFGIALCLLLAFFAVERRVAAYPSTTHNVAAITTAATGVQKPEHITFADPHTLDAPAILLCVVAVFAVCQTRRVWRPLDPAGRTTFSAWAPTPLAVRPPPAF